MKEKITVTQDDIREACFRRDANDYVAECECPIARAAQRAHPNATVGRDFLKLERLQRRIDLPNEAVRFIRRFDNEVPVEPFEFEIEV